MKLIAQAMFLVAFSAVAAPPPELIGRWGNEFFPSQIRGPETKYVAVITMGVECPLVRRIIPGLNDLHAKYLAQGVQLVGLFPNSGTDVFSVADYATEMDIAFPVFLDDPKNRWSELLGLSKTPQVVLLAEGDRIIYQGAVEQPNRAHLQIAIEEALAQMPVSVPDTATTGCEIVRQSHKSNKGAEPTFYADILPIIQNRCQSCHREGDLAGTYYTFDTYEDAADNFETLFKRVERRLMPPWHAKIEDTKKWGHFIGDMSLSEKEIETLRRWGQGQKLEGNPADAPPTPTRVAPGSWEIGNGKPDLIYQMETPYEVPEKRLDQYQYYRVPINAPEDRWIRGVQLRPGNLNVVHHLGALLAPHTEEKFEGHQMMMRVHGLTGESALKVGDYVSGDPFNARTYADNEAIKIPAHHDVIFEIHYAPTGKKEEPDVSSLGIVWADKAPEREIINRVFTTKKIHIPEGAQHFKLERYIGLEHDSVITAIGPHMHFRGKSFSLYRVFDRETPNEKRELIYRVPTYNFGWQRTYELEKPIHLNAGEFLVAVVHFDNSHFNPGNPDPSTMVHYGTRSEDEMFNVRLKYYRAD